MAYKINVELLITQPLLWPLSPTLPSSSTIGFILLPTKVYKRESTFGQISFLSFRPCNNTHPYFKAL